MTENKPVITGTQLKFMLLGAYHSFEKNYQLINDLNVFPVPDGDTGTNMMYTMGSVARALSSMSDNANVGEIGAAAARSAVMGARGNSGVILSQLLRGIGRGVAGKITVDNNELGKAFQFGILYAYRSVSKPVEGTILSVARGMAKGAYEAVRSGESLEAVLQEAIRSGRKELARTPEQLPALKAAGVVDAGGQGLIAFFEGCLAGLRGEDCAELEITGGVRPEVMQGEEIDLEYPYCTEMIVRGASVDRDTVGKALQPLGNSMIVAVLDDIVKVHIHTNVPGQVLNIASQWGSLHDIKIDNMADQHNHRMFREETAPAAKHGLGVLSVAAGDGIGALMEKMGAAVISGGQSMNPPVADFVRAVEAGSCEQYIILPNNKNIILAAEQAQKMLGAARVAFVPTTNLAQGLAALLNFSNDRSMEDNLAEMTRSSGEITSGAVTMAVRDSVVNGIEVRQGEYLGLLNDKIVCTGSDVKDVMGKLLDGGDYELLSMYYGSQISAEEAQALAEYVQALNKDWEVEMFYGGQPLYPVLLAME